ncbi:pilus assembly protein TadG-related protein [Methylobacterium sp. A54F]
MPTPSFLPLRAARARGGNVSLVFAVLAVPLLGGVGLAVDFGTLLNARTACQTAADAAALYASGVAKNLVQQSDGSDAAVAAAFTEAKSRAEALFRAHVARTGTTAVSGTVTLAKRGQTILAAAAFDVSTRTAIGGLFGVSTLRSIGTAKSSASMPLYTDLYMALDVSQSMGLASTDAGAKQLFGRILQMEKDAGNKSAKGCVFGCHVPQNGSALAQSYQAVAKAASIQLRIDVLQSAVSKTVTTAQADAANLGTSNYRIGLYAMGLASANATTSGLTELAALTSNWVTLQNAARAIDLGPNNGGGTGDSFFTEPLNALRGKIPASGDGSSQAASKAFLFIVTDGLRDVKGACTSGHCTAAFDPGVCDAYKRSNITVGVIYTTFLPILANPTNGSAALDDNYKALVQPYAAQIAPNLQACASPGWYAEASDGPAIDAALAKMFAQTSLQAQLTN